MQKIVIKGLSFLLTLSVFFTFSASPALAAVNYLYDANGNMTSDGTKCYEYNEANQLKKVKRCSDSQVIAEYIYDYNGTRLVKKEYTNGVLSKTIYSPADEYETVKLASNGATANTSYYKVNDEVVAKKNPDGSITYYHNDHLGSTAVLSNQAGALVEKTSYEPYGEVKSGGTQSKFGYTGQEQDNESGLDYYNARYYNPHMQRFTQPDSYTQNIYDPQDLNSYSYVKNNPIKYTDPSGHFVWVPLIIIGAGAVLGAGSAMYDFKQQNPNANNWQMAGAGLVGGALGAGAAAVALYASVGVLGAAVLGGVSSGLQQLAFNGIAQKNLGTDLISETAYGVAFNSVAAKAAKVLIPKNVGRPIIVNTSRSLIATFQNNSLNKVSRELGENAISTSMSVNKTSLNIIARNYSNKSTSTVNASRLPTTTVNASRVSVSSAQCYCSRAY